MTTEIKVRRFSSADSDFDIKLKALLAFETAQDDSVDEVVANILKDVKKRGMLQCWTTPIVLIKPMPAH
jgi:histidinol dehydrogenase